MGSGVSGKAGGVAGWVRFRGAVKMTSIPAYYYVGMNPETKELTKSMVNNVELTSESSEPSPQKFIVSRLQFQFYLH